MKDMTEKILNILQINTIMIFISVYMTQNKNQKIYTEKEKINKKGKEKEKLY